MAHVTNGYAYGARTAPCPFGLDYQMRDREPVGTGAEAVTDGSCAVAGETEGIVAPENKEFAAVVSYLGRHYVYAQLDITAYGVGASAAGSAVAVDGAGTAAKTPPGIVCVDAAMPMVSGAALSG